MDALNIILVIIFILVGIILGWALYEVAITVKKLREKSLATIEELKPSIDNVQKMIATIEPIVKKIDPLVDRATLTIDSVNLEILRVDEILEDVAQITDTVSSTMDTVNSVTSAPMDMVTNMTKKFRNKFKPKYASDASVKAGLTEGKKPSKQANPIVDFAESTIDAASEAYHETRDKTVAQKAARKIKSAKSNAKSAKISSSSEKLSDSILSQVNKDTSSSSASGYTTIPTSDNNSTEDIECIFDVEVDD